MRLNFFPRSYDFNAAFQRQNGMVKSSALALHKLFTYFSNVDELIQKIQKCEVEGDRCAREITKHLSLTFITPIDREDILSLIIVQEDILNLIKAIATRIGLYQFSKIQSGAAELVTSLKGMVDLTSEMLAKYIAKKDMSDCITRFKKLKTEADALILVTLGEIYESESAGVNAILDIVKWTHIHDRIEQAILRVEDLANVIEGIALKYV